jgi:hypothetical protein
MQILRSRGALVALGGFLVVVVAIGATLAVINGGPQPTPIPSPSPSPTPTASPSPTPEPTPSPSPSPTPEPTPSPTPAARCPMNGELVDQRAYATRVPLLVQIENNPIARPPSGLNLADLVIEAPVEGDTTRFAAVFMCDEEVAAAVGPVRSARYFNIDYWQQMRVVTLHFGGASKVLSRFNSVSMPFLNGLTGGWGFFFRAGPWGAPHNVFLDVNAARAEVEDGGSLDWASRAAGEVRAPFRFEVGRNLPDGGRAVDAIGLQTSSFWRFGWEWNEDTSHWYRTDGGAPNFDAVTGERISARTVVVQIVRQEVLVGENDPGGFPRRYQFLVDSGDGILYVNGEAHDVHWSRPTAEDVTTWTYADSGEEVILPPGRVWWEIVPVGSGIYES